MKPNRFERSYRDTTPIHGVTVRMLSNKTPIHRAIGMLAFNCDQCGLAILKSWAHAKRTNHHFCGTACANAFRRIRVPQRCVVCRTEFMVIPSNLRKVITCSRKCLKINRSKLMLDQVADMENSPVFNYGQHEHTPIKLSENDVLAIRKDKRPQYIIASDYGIGQSMVSLIKRNKTWRHIPGACSQPA